MTRESDGASLGSLPSVDRVLNTPDLLDLRQRYSHGVVVGLVRRILSEHRARVALGGMPPADIDIAREVVETVEREWTAVSTRVINATGVILHTNLGRAPLSEDALTAMQDAAGYSDLEFDLETGGRSSRQLRVSRLLRAITGAPAAHVVVNNAAAVTLALAVVAKGKDVIVSRGQAVEIGGGFRVPVILRQSGARLVEVGTTNRTRLKDYEDAITDRTAAILHVHTSNFKVVGFAEAVPLSALGRLARARSVSLVDDNGSGALLDTARFGLAHEPTPLEALAAGADITAFSGDKLLGGPQSGILLGSDTLMARLAKHPLARAMRPDKTTLAALSATLLPYLRGDAETSIPVWRMIALSSAEIAARAEAWCDLARERGLAASTVAGESTVGGGSLPGETLPTTLIALPKPVTARALRRVRPPVVARTREEGVILDLRTVARHEESALLEGVLEAFHAARRPG